MKTSKFDPVKKSEKPRSSKNKKNTKQNEKNIFSPATEEIIKSRRYMGHSYFQLEDDARCMMHYGHYTYYTRLTDVSVDYSIRVNVRERDGTGTKIIVTKDYNPKGPHYMEISLNNTTIKYPVRFPLTTTTTLFEIHLSLFNQIYNLCSTL